MTIPLKQTAFVKNFVCLGDACEDTCCKGWGMQVGSAMVEKYKQEAPELLEAVTSGEAEHIMKRDAVTDYCVKYEGGWCGIHKTRGTAFLGDACHFYPRITRALGDANIMSATLSCPEVVRQVLSNESAFELHDTVTDRLPESIKNYLPGGMNEAEALSVHKAFVDAALNSTVPFERSFSRIASVSRSLENLPVASWAAAVPFYLEHSDSRLPSPESKPEDPFNLLHTLCGLIAASKKTERPRLMQTIADMETALHATLDWNNVAIILKPSSADASHSLNEKYKSSGALLIQDVLRKWLAAELSMSLYPLSGFGETLSQRITTLGVRCAILKLALMACFTHNDMIRPDDCVRIIQSLSRFLDHLADPTLMLNICAETGWNREARLRGLIGDS